MNIVDALMQADANKTKEYTTKKIKSNKLARIIGAEEPVEITIREIKPRRFNDLSTRHIKSNGDVDYSKFFDTKLIIVTEGVEEPNLKDKKLQEHFGVERAVDLAEILFGSEINTIADAITEISGYTDDIEEEVEDIKN